MSGKDRHLSLTQRVLESGLWGERPLFLLDVGCSGGIEHRWQRFGDRLRAVGFDPLVAEIDRLNAANTHPGVRYEAAFVTCHGYDQLFPPELRQDRVRSKNNDPFSRVSAAAAMRRMPVSYVQQMFNSGASVVLSDRTVVLDDFVSAGERAHVDFVKIDTDGHDIEAVLGARGIMDAGGILGLSVESQFHGATHDFANTFANIDRILRQQGFSLFELPGHRYSRTALPAPFALDRPAQTTSGQLMWAEALYFRDLAAPEYEQMWPYEITPGRVMKLACLFEQFGLPDCAAELLLNRGGFLDPQVQEQLLDALASGGPGSYAARVAKFERDFTEFYASRMPQPGSVQKQPKTKAARTSDSDVIQRSQKQVTELLRRNAALRERLGARGDRMKRMARRIDDLQARQRK